MSVELWLVVEAKWGGKTDEEPREGNRTSWTASKAATDRIFRRRGQRQDRWFGLDQGQPTRGGAIERRQHDQNRPGPSASQSPDRTTGI
ncbi:hypothetical protein FQN53_009198 [Emmonsiellopsis sp. PD_33]|nr:hypothetical protein FQN53_009198 [Emmonsiellopsis sp. PD_33]